MLATLQNAPYKDTGHGVPDELRFNDDDDWVSILVTHTVRISPQHGDTSWP